MIFIGNVEWLFRWSGFLCYCMVEGIEWVTMILEYWFIRVSNEMGISLVGN